MRPWLALVVLGVVLAACGPGNIRPIAKFSVSQKMGDPLTTFAFDGSASNDPDGSVVAYAWDFGDGATAAGKTTSHVFSEPADYDVTLTVTDTTGWAGSTTKTVTVKALGTVDGHVVNRKGGTPVSGTTVTDLASGRTGVTDASGYYSLTVAEGSASLTFDKPGHAQSRVDGLVVAADATTSYDTIQQAAFDPFLPVGAPSLTVDPVDEGTAAVDADSDTFPVTVSGTTLDPDTNGFVFLNAALGQVGGSSGYLNTSATSATSSTFDGSSTTLHVSATGFDGATELYVVAYDLNGNRAERIVHLDVMSGLAGGANLGPVTDVFAQALTFGDTSVFGTLGGDLGFRGAELLQAVRTNDLVALNRMAAIVHEAAADPQPQGFLDEALTWVDVTFDYDDTTFDRPTAFEVYRRLGDEASERRIGRFSPDHAGAQIGPQSYVFRDATGGLTAGTEATYRVAAVTGDHHGSAPGDASDSASTTPLPEFHVTAGLPADGANDVSVVPTYHLSLVGRSDTVYLGIIVLDRVHSEGNFLEWQSSPLMDDTGLTEAAIPHNFDDTASTPTLQPYHAYDWQPLAMTVTADGTAIALAQDYFNLFGVFAGGLDFGPHDGPVHTFLTGDGTY